MSKFISLQRLAQPWLLSATDYDNLRETILGVDANVDVSPQEQEAYQQSNGIALLSLRGTMIKNPTPMEQAFVGATCTQAFTNSCNAIRENPAISGVILDIDSGGGSVQGVIEASQAVRELHEQKPVVTFTDGLMASASYWVGSQGTTIVATPSSRIGSIGVYVPVVDCSAQYKDQGVDVSVITNAEGIHKGAGLEGTSLTSEQQDQIQAEVDEIYAEFRDAVLSVRTVPSDAMQGQAFMGKRAKEKNLIDAVGSIEDAFFLLNNEIKNRS